MTFGGKPYSPWRWWAARGSTVSRQIREYKRKDKGQGQEREYREKIFVRLYLNRDVDGEFA